MMSSNLHEVNPHLALWQSETSVSSYERRFAAFCRKVAAAIGVPHLDGADRVEGYSIDLAGAMFDDGFSISEAVAEIRAIQRQLRN